MAIKRSQTVIPNGFFPIVQGSDVQGAIHKVSEFSKLSDYSTVGELPGYLRSEGMLVFASKESEYYCLTKISSEMDEMTGEETFKYTWRTLSSIVGGSIISNVFIVQMDTDGDSFIEFGEIKTLTCTLLDYRGEDVTDLVTSWHISRETGHDVEDTAWGIKQKVKAFNAVVGRAASIDIYYTSSENDLGLGDKATFIVEATLEGGITTKGEYIM